MPHISSIPDIELFLGGADEFDDMASVKSPNPLELLNPLVGLELTVVF